MRNGHGQDHDSAAKRGGFLDGLEPDGHPVEGDERRAALDKSRQADAGVDAPLEQPGWDQGQVAFVPYPAAEEQKGDDTAAQETDDHGRVPGVFCAAPLQTKEEEHVCEPEDEESHNINLGRQLSPGRFAAGRRVLGYLDDKTDEENNNTPNGQVSATLLV